MTMITMMAYEGNDGNEDIDVLNILYLENFGQKYLENFGQQYLENFGQKYMDNFGQKYLDNFLQSYQNSRNFSIEKNSRNGNVIILYNFCGIKIFFLAF